MYELGHTISVTFLGHEKDTLESCLRPGFPDLAFTLALALDPGYRGACSPT